MRRVILTGANGSGKSHLAAQIAELCPDLPLVSYDALRLTTGWQKRPQAEIDAALAEVVAGESWVLEGGPSLLGQALPRAEAILWLDPPMSVRAWRLLLRPWRHPGHTRLEIPDGNPDWPIEQYRFALRSLLRTRRFRAEVVAALRMPNAPRLWHIRNRAQRAAALCAIGALTEAQPEP